jgi:putative SOS response-associated peptidase YedK
VSADIDLMTESGERRLVALCWGLIPFWTKDAKIGYSTINAMAETAATKPAYRDAFKSQRCLVPADGFYEWKKLDAKTKRPNRMVLARLYSNFEMSITGWTSQTVLGLA